MDKSRFNRLHFILASLLVSQFVLLVAAFNDDWHASLFASVLISLFFVWSHVRYTPSELFLAEFSDQYGRGEPQEVLVLGAVLKAETKVDFGKDDGWLANGWTRTVIAQIAVAVLTLAVSHFVGSTTGFLIFGVLIGWAFARCRAFLWLPITGATLILVLIFAKNSFFRLGGAGAFLAYYSIYRQSLLSWASEANPEPVADGLRALVRPALIFATFFCGSAYLFPDVPMQQQIEHQRHELARKIDRGTSWIGRTTGQILPRHDHAPASPFSGGSAGASTGSGSNAGAGGSGISGGAASTGSPSESMAQAGDGGDKPSAANSANGSREAAPGNAPNDSGGDEANNSPEQQAQAVREMKIEQSFAHFEKLLKLLMVAAACVFLFLLVDKKRRADGLTKEERTRREKALDDAIAQIRNLRKKKFKNHREEIIAAYHAYLSILAMRGLVKWDWQTPRQFVSEAVQKGDPMKAFSPDLTRFFAKVYYGQLDLEPQEQNRFREFVNRIAI